MNRSDSLVELAKALSKFQGAMHSVNKGSVNPYFKAKYADLDAVWDACRKPLSENGLSLAQATVDGDGKLYLETLLLHTSGEYLSSRYPLTPMRQVQGQGWAVADDPQSIGSAITYARRYAMSAMLGISADEDDDGEKATKKEAPADAQETATPRGLCPVHHVSFVERPGGVSKATGRPYPAFWACPAKVGRGYCQEKPKAPQPMPIEPTEEKLGFSQEEEDIDPETLPWDALQPHQETLADPPAPAAHPQAGPALPPFPIRGEREAAVNYFLKVAKVRYGLAQQKDALAVIGGTWSGWVDKAGGDGEAALQQALAKLAPAKVGR